MNRLTEQQQIDKRTRHLAQHLEANKLKTKLEKLGYLYTISLYGVIENPTTNRNEYRRIEVFLNGLPTQISVNEIRQFFREFPTYQYYSIWAYNKEAHEIVLIESWE